MVEINQLHDLLPYVLALFLGLLGIVSTIFPIIMAKFITILVPKGDPIKRFYLSDRGLFALRVGGVATLVVSASIFYASITGMVWGGS